MRKISVEFNKFKNVPSKLANSSNATKFRNEIEIDLDELSRMYIIEELDMFSSTCSSSDYIDLRLLRKNTNLFKFQLGHPGSSKDSRKERSRVIGQTIMRYFLHEFLDAKFVVHVSTFLNKSLGSHFGGYQLIRTKDGDTPDFICASNSSDIFLAEAKGRRVHKVFSDVIFKNARNQFKRVKLEKNGKTISLDGYIGVFIIANENNKLYNSKLLVEDPATEGEQFIESSELFNLVKMGHYSELLNMLGLDFIAQSLLGINRIVEDKLPFNVYSNKLDSREYIGIFLSNLRVIFPFRPYFELDDPYFNWNKMNSKHFIGLDRELFEIILRIARGNIQAIDEIKFSKKEILNNITCKYPDGLIISDSYLMDYKRLGDF